MDYHSDADLVVDLVSDTSSKPTAGMRKAMADADVGDEQRGEDPTTLALCERVADMLGKESAIFLPSGIMSNVVAILTHCRPGDDVVCSADAHIIGSEGGGIAALGGISITPIVTENGIYTVEQFNDHLRPKRARSPFSRLAHVEQTTNKGGGDIWPVETIASVAEAARAYDMAIHMDGARLLNAAVASGRAAKDFTDHVDSVWIDLSKGLGAPVGSVLAASKDFIAEAWAWKHRVGGAMRQSGVLAAAGLYALDNHIDRLADDHTNAKRLAAHLSQMPGITLKNPDVPTNLVFIDVSGTGKKAGDIQDALRAHGVRIGAANDKVMRAVTHIGVDADGIEKAASAFRTVLAS